jgi:hypothetical protein
MNPNYLTKNLRFRRKRSLVVVTSQLGQRNYVYDGFLLLHNVFRYVFISSFTINPSDTLPIRLMMVFSQLC